MPSLENRPLYLWDFEFQFSDLLDFIEFSERNLDWQRQSHIQSLNRQTRLNEYNREEYHAELENIEYRFQILLSRKIRYSAIISLITTLDWIASFLKKRVDEDLPEKPAGKNETIFILQTLYHMSNSSIENNLNQLEKLVKVRNCIVHSGGIVGDYRYGGEIEEIVTDFEGITISDEGFMENSIHIEKGVIEAIAIKTQSWIVDFIEECKLRLNTTIGV